MMNGTRVLDNITEQFLASYPVKAWEELGLFNASDLSVINPHWMNFPPPRPGSHFLIAMMYVIVMTIGVGSNFLVITLLLKWKRLLTTPNILVLNLAFSDMIMLMKSPILVINCIWNGPVMGSLGCKIYGFIGGLTGTTSIMTLAVIAFNRYLAISKPLDSDRHVTALKSFFQISLIWIYASVFSSLPLFGINRYVPEGYLTSCSFDYLSDGMSDRLFILIFFIGAWLVPFITISFCYIKIVKSVREHNKQNVNDSAMRNKRIEVTIARIVFSLIAVWMVAWTPYAIVALIGISGHKSLITPLASMIPGLVCKVSACINPFLYALSHPQIKKEILRLLQKFCLASKDDPMIILDFIQKKRHRRNSSADYSYSEDRMANKESIKLEDPQKQEKLAVEIHPLKNARISS